MTTDPPPTAHDVRFILFFCAFLAWIFSQDIPQWHGKSILWLVFMLPVWDVYLTRKSALRAAERREKVNAMSSQQQNRGPNTPMEPLPPAIPADAPAK